MVTKTIKAAGPTLQKQKQNFVIGPLGETVIEATTTSSLWLPDPRILPMKKGAFYVIYYILVQSIFCIVEDITCLAMCFHPPVL